MIKFETLYCQSCGRSWSRKVVRGRKPALCETCRYWGVVRVNITPVAPANLIKTDAGQSDAGIRDTNDCTVKALANATGAPYAEAHTFMAANGRRKGRGTNFKDVIIRNDCKVFGYDFIYTPVIRTRGIRTFLFRNPQFRQGTYIVKMRGHVAALKDGKLLDSFDSSRKDILYVWKVTKATKEVPEA